MQNDNISEKILSFHPYQLIVNNEPCNLADF